LVGVTPATKAMEKVTGILSFNVCQCVGGGCGGPASGRFGGVRAQDTETIVLSGYTLEL
jgi:hypothetical protein